MAIQAEAFARAGLIGNPSDGYNGKTISLVIAPSIKFRRQPELAMGGLGVRFDPSHPDHTLWCRTQRVLDGPQMSG